MKKRKALKITLFSLGGLLVLAAAGLMVYRFAFSMGVTESYKIGNPDSDNRFLAVTQSSNYKNAIMEEVTENVPDDMCIDVIDVTNLNDLDGDNYDGVYFVATIQSSDIPAEIYSFWNRYPGMPSQMVFTASSGKWEPSDTIPDGIDIISSASTKDNTNEIANDLLEFFLSCSKH